MPRRDEAKAQEQAIISQNHPAYCPNCKKLSMAAFPVHLRELSGEDTEVCKVVKCGYCNKIKHYGLNMAIGKYNGKKMFVDYNRWEELKRNNISPDDFIDAVLNCKETHIWLDAKNGLRAVEPEGKSAELLKRLRSFSKQHGTFWRIYD